MSDAASDLQSAAAAKYQQGMEMARNALEEVKKKLAEFDTSHASEKASQYLSTALEKVQAALAELGHVTEQLKSGPAEIPVKAITNALASASAAFTQLQEKAKQYDEEYKLSSRVSAVVAHPQEQASAALATIAAYAAHASDTANAQLQGVSHGLRAKLTDAASAGLDKALPQAVKADEMFHVSERAAATKALLVQTAKDLEEKFGISGYLSQARDQAQNLDQKWLGGRVAPALISAYKMGLSMVGTVQEKYEEKKKEMAGSAPAPAASTTSGSSA